MKLSSSSPTESVQGLGMWREYEEDILMEGEFYSMLTVQSNSVSSLPGPG